LCQGWQQQTPLLLLPLLPWQQQQGGVWQQQGPLLVAQQLWLLQALQVLQLAHVWSPAGSAAAALMSLMGPSGHASHVQLRQQHTPIQMMGLMVVFGSKQSWWTCMSSRQLQASWAAAGRVGKERGVQQQEQQLLQGYYCHQQQQEPL
jgi:hypothetical protein